MSAWVTLALRPRRHREPQRLPSLSQILRPMSTPGRTRLNPETSSNTTPIRHLSFLSLSQSSPPRRSNWWRNYRGIGVVVACNPTIPCARSLHYLGIGKHIKYQDSSHKMWSRMFGNDMLFLVCTRLLLVPSFSRPPPPLQRVPQEQSDRGRRIAFPVVSLSQRNGNAPSRFLHPFPLHTFPFPLPPNRNARRLVQSVPYASIQTPRCCSR